MRIVYTGQERDEHTGRIIKRTLEFNYKEKEEDLFNKRMKYIEENYGLKLDPIGFQVGDEITFYAPIVDMYDVEEWKEAWRDAKKSIK